MMKLSSRKDLLKEADCVLREIKQKNRRVISENKITDSITSLSSMAERIAKDRFDDLLKFMDTEKIKNELPYVSIDDIEMNFIKSFNEIKTNENTHYIINENFIDFIRNISLKTQNFIKNTTVFIKIISKIPGILKYLRYVNDIPGFIRYYSQNMTTDGSTYEGITDKMVNSIHINSNESYNQNKKLTSIILSIVFLVIMMSVVLGGASSIYAQDKIKNKEKIKHQDTTQVIDMGITKRQNDKSDDIFKPKGAEPKMQTRYVNKAERDIFNDSEPFGTLDRMDRKWSGFENSILFQNPK